MEEEKMDTMNESLSENAKCEKKTMKAKTKKYLAGFLALIVVCTVVSRATASFTTPMVTTANSKRGSLTYKIDGNGSIETSSEVYYDVEPELKIGKVCVKAGDSVEDGQVLYEYDMKVLEKKIENAKKAVKTSEQAVKKQELNESMEEMKGNCSSEQKAYTRAKEDYEAAVKALEKAENEYNKKAEKIKKNMTDTQQTEYEEAKKGYENALENKEEVLETCQKAYDTAKKNYESAKKTKQNALDTADEELQNAKDSLAELTKKRDALEDCMKEYIRYAKLKDRTNCSNAEDKLFREYFGKSEYEDIQKEIKSKQKELQIAKDDYEKATKSWTRKVTKASTKLSHIQVGTEEYADAYDAYVDLQIDRDADLERLQRNIDNCTEAVDNVNKKYKEIDTAASAYRDLLIQNASAENETLYHAFYNAVIDDKVLDKKAITSAEKLIDKKQKAYNDTVAEQEELVANAKQAVKEAKQDMEKKTAKEDSNIQDAEEKMTKLLGKDYSGEDDLQAAWATVENQQSAVKSAKRAMDDAKDTLDTALDKLALDNKNQGLKDQIAELDEETLQADVADKKEILDRLKKLHKEGGKVKANIAGRISNLDVVTQSTTSGSEKVSITPSSTVFTGSIDKDSRKYVEEGATISLKLDTQEKSIDAEIISIRYDAANTNYSFTAKLPDGNYMPGTGGSYHYTQQSQKYDAIIPLSALRQEQNQYFVLVLYETETVLGKETVAQRVAVEVTSKDTQYAAVENVYPDMQVITGSSRNIGEGDRVRIGKYE